MDVKLKITFFFIFIFLMNNLSATSLNIGDDSNKLSTFEMGSFEERIIIADKDAIIKDIFRFRIGEENLDQKLKILINQDFIFRRENTFIKDPKISFCSVGNSDFIDEIGWTNWGLRCNEGSYNFIWLPGAIIDLNSIVLSEINLSKLNWKNHEINSSFRTVYVQVEYTIKDFIIENEGEHKLLWIKKIWSDQTHLKEALYKNSTLYLIMPSKDTIVVNKDDLEFNGFDMNGRMILKSSSPNKDFFIAYRDIMNEKSRAFLHDLFLIVITLSISLFVIGIAKNFNEYSSLGRIIFYMLAGSLFGLGFSGLKEKFAWLSIFFVLTICLFYTFQCKFKFLYKKRNQQKSRANKIKNKSVKRKINKR